MKQSYGDPSYNIIATFDHSLANGKSGIVKILFYYDRENPALILPTDPEIFKEGKCWISSGYDEIEGKIPSNAPFIVRNIERTDDYELTPAATDSRVDWWGKGHAFEKLSDSSFVPVFKSSLPTLDYGQLEDLNVHGFTKIMILNDGSLYGPFDITVLGDQSLSATPSTMALNLPAENIIQISFLTVSETDIFVRPPSGYRIPIEGFITSLKDFKREFRGGWTTIDYINNDRLIRYISGLRQPGASKQLMTKRDVGEVVTDIRAFLKSKIGQQNDSARLDRAVALLEELDSSSKSNLGIFKTFIESVLNSPNGKNVIARWAKDSGVQLGESKLTDTSQSKEAEHERSKLSKEILRLSSRRDDLLDEIKLQKDDLEKSKQLSADMTAAEIQKNTVLEAATLTTELSELNESIELRKKESNDLEKSYQVLQEKHDLAEQVDRVKSKVDHLRDDENRLNNVVEKLKNEIGDPDLGVKIASLKRMIGWLHSGTSTVSTLVPHEYESPQLLSLKTDDTNSMMDIIHTISDRLSNTSHGRPFSEAEVANLMICTQQSLLTILHGRPGVGKTSSAIRIATEMGLISSECNPSDNFLNIAVGRGWMSTRDFIGYYNSLKNVYQSAGTGLFAFLKQGSTPKASSTLRLVLLDEANLSPIEHYWSDFIGLCDQEGYDRPINTGIPGEDGSLYVNSNRNLRFIATINNDSTTEPISPRLLDRAPVISMDLPDNNTINSGISIDEMTGAIPLAFLEKNLGTISQPAELVISEQRISSVTLQEMIDIASNRNSTHGEPIELSPRREAAIQRYVCTAALYMEDRVATDFAISQFILPLIRGDHEGFIDRLRAMETCADKNRLDRSKEIISRIISRGNSYLNSYSFL
jgi:MoxR-like ATPase